MAGRDERRPRMRLPSKRMFNRHLTESTGQDVILFEVLEVSPGAVVHIEFVSESSPWPQGVWIAVEGMLSLDGDQRPQFVIWTSPDRRSAELAVLATEDGLLRLYNVWDRRGTGGAAWDSQGYTSGMLRTDLPDGTIEYRCNDSGADPAFDRLVFTVTVR